MNMPTAIRVDGSLFMNSDAANAFAALGYGLCTGEIDLTGYRLPRLPHRETNDEKFQRMLANDPIFKQVYNELNDKYWVR